MNTAVAVNEILTAGFGENNYLDLDETQRTALLIKLISSNHIVSLNEAELSPHSRGILDVVLCGLTA